MMAAQTLERLVRRNFRARIGECLIDTLAQPIAERCLFAIEGAYRSPHHLARGRIGPGLHPRRDALLQVAQRDGDRTACAWHGFKPYFENDGVILKRFASVGKRPPARGLGARSRGFMAKTPAWVCNRTQHNLAAQDDQQPIYAERRRACRRGSRTTAGRSGVRGRAILPAGPGARFGLRYQIAQRRSRSRCDRGRGAERPQVTGELVTLLEGRILAHAEGLDKRILDRLSAALIERAETCQTVLA